MVLDYFAIFKKIIHGLDPGEMPSNSDLKWHSDYNFVKFLDENNGVWYFER